MLVFYFTNVIFALFVCRITQVTDKIMQMKVGDIAKIAIKVGVSATPFGVLINGLFLKEDTRRCEKICYNDMCYSKNINLEG